MSIKLFISNYEELKDVENFLFRFIYPKSFRLQIIIEDEKAIYERFNYKTVYNDLAHGLILETI